MEFAYGHLLQTKFAGLPGLPSLHPVWFRVVGRPQDPRTLHHTLRAGLSSIRENTSRAALRGVVDDATRGAQHGTRVEPKRRSLDATARANERQLRPTKIPAGNLTEPPLPATAGVEQSFVTLRQVVPVGERVEEKPSTARPPLAASHHGQIARPRSVGARPRTGARTRPLRRKLGNPKPRATTMTAAPAIHPIERRE